MLSVVPEFFGDIYKVGCIILTGILCLVLASWSRNVTHITLTEEHSNEVQNNQTNDDNIDEDYSPSVDRSLDPIYPKNIQTIGMANTQPSKVHSFSDGSLRGGYFVLNKQGYATTLSFCFDHNSSNYGLTAGHLAKDGEPVYAFCCNYARSFFYSRDNDTISPHYTDDDANQVKIDLHSLVEIGVVVSTCHLTNSLVFRIHDDVPVNLNMLRCLDSKISLPCPNPMPTPPKKGTYLHGFTTHHYGSNLVAKVCDPPTIQASRRFYGFSTATIGIVQSANFQGKILGLEDLGDSGSIFVASETGEALYFHQSANETISPHRHKVSFGVPLAVVMAYHTELGGKTKSSHCKKNSCKSHSRSKLSASSASSYRKCMRLFHAVIINDRRVLQKYKFRPSAISNLTSQAGDYLFQLTRPTGVRRGELMSTLNQNQLNNSPILAFCRAETSRKINWQLLILATAVIFLWALNLGGITYLLNEHVKQVLPTA